MTKVQLPKLWTCVDQVIRDDERGAGPSRAQSDFNATCARSPSPSRRARRRKDSLAFHPDHILIVRTPPRAGLGFAVKAVLRGTASVVPHLRIPRSDVSALQLGPTPPPEWHLLSDFLFLRITTATGDNWHWVDRDSMQGKMQRFADAVAAFTSPGTTQRPSGPAVAMNKPAAGLQRSVSSRRDAFTFRNGARR